VVEGSEEKAPESSSETKGEERTNRKTAKGKEGQKERSAKRGKCAEITDPSADVDRATVGVGERGRTQHCGAPFRLQRASGLRGGSSHGLFYASPRAAYIPLVPPVRA